MTNALRRMFGRDTGPRRSASLRSGKVIITGTGRAGTTLLVRILTRLGLDTSFAEADLQAVEAEIGRAGLERPINAQTAPGLPEIIKTPYLTEMLGPALAQGWFTVDHAIVPVRALTDAAHSRASVSEKAKALGRDPFYTPGGLWDVRDPADQRDELARKLSNLIETLVAHEIPTTLIGFPRFAREPDYFVRILGGFLHERYGLPEADLRKAHARETNLSFIGTYQS
jgi:hypothetical protein